MALRVIVGIDSFLEVIMQLLKGNMWSAFDNANHFIFTGNSFIKGNGALVMGRGIAREVRDRFSGIDLAIGRAVHAKKKDEFYGLILGRKIGVFQVKTAYDNSAQLDLIQRSTDMLREKAESNPEESFHMNFPGIGNGHLDYRAVLPLLEELPDNVYIWTFK